MTDHRDPTDLPAAETRGSGSSPTSTDTDGASRTGIGRWRLPLAIVVLGTLVVALTALLLPGRYDATSAVGLRAASEGGNQADIAASADSLKQVAQQEAVASGAPGHVESIGRSIPVSRDAKATANLDPDSTTIRIVAQGVSARESSALANALADDAVKRIGRDGTARAVVLERADPTYAEKKPNRLLVAGAGEAAVLAAAALAGAARGRP